jgi:hypothetical protein
MQEQTDVSLNEKIREAIKIALEIEKRCNLILMEKEVSQQCKG